MTAQALKLAFCAAALLAGACDARPVATSSSAATEAPASGLPVDRPYTRAEFDQAWNDMTSRHFAPYYDLAEKADPALISHRETLYERYSASVSRNRSGQVAHRPHMQDAKNEDRFALAWAPAQDLYLLARDYQKALRVLRREDKTACARLVRVTYSDLSKLSPKAIAALTDLSRRQIALGRQGVPHKGAPPPALDPSAVERFYQAYRRTAARREALALIDGQERYARAPDGLLCEQAVAFFDALTSLPPKDAGPLLAAAPSYQYTLGYRIEPVPPVSDTF